MVSGLRWGLTVALLYSLYVLLLVAMSGSRALLENGVTLGGVLVAYGVTGTFGGLLVGLAWPLGRYLWGAIIIGYGVAAILFFAPGLSEAPLSAWQKQDFTEVFILAAILGPAGGSIVWHQNRRK